MAKNIIKVKKRIATVKSTRKITNSMKLVSSVKVRKLTKEYSANCAYFDELLKLFDKSIFYVEDEKITFDSPYLKENNSSNKTLYIIISSNMGLCGSYNAMLFKFFEEIYKTDDEIIVIGKKGINYFKDFEKKEADFAGILHHISIDDVYKLTNYIMKKYESGEFKEIKFVYEKYINSLKFKPSTFKILPIEVKTKPFTDSFEPIYEEGKNNFIQSFIPEFVKSCVLHILYEASLSEETNRRNSMDNANKNIDELLKDLNLEYNKARQAAITNQINEVVSGAQAIKND
ncbi:MAG: ATP synthase F1 subunit gamma [Bacilli bacterium]|nr:ATP synthase F1 subunit gamma [Bacilli bacterium]